MENLSKIKIDLNKYEYKKEIKVTDKEVADILYFLDYIKNGILNNEKLLINIWECKKYSNLISNNSDVSICLIRIEDLCKKFINILRNTYVVKLNTYEDTLEAYKKINNRCDNPILKNMEHFKILKEQNRSMLAKSLEELKLDEKYYEVDEELMYPKYEDLKRQYSILLYVEPEEIKNTDTKEPFGLAFRISK